MAESAADGLPVLHSLNLGWYGVGSPGPLKLRPAHALGDEGARIDRLADNPLVGAV